MEKMYKRVPFKIEIAKKIQSGEVEGRIVTNSGNICRFLNYDCIKIGDEDYFAFSVSHPSTSDKRALLLCTPCGSCIEGSEFNLFIELPEETPICNNPDSPKCKTCSNRHCNDCQYNKHEFKAGDKVIVNIPVDQHDILNDAYDGKQCVIKDIDKWGFATVSGDGLPDREFPSHFLKRHEGIPKHEFKVGDKVCIGYHEEGEEIYKIIKISANLAFLNDGSTIPLDCLALIERKHHEFKPFDKVLVRVGDNSEWCAAIYSHYCPIDTYIASGRHWKHCVPYEGNEYLLGTTNNPKED